MITITTRPFTDKEIKRQTKQLPSVYKRVEGFVMKFIFIVLVLDIPLLVYDHFSPVASQTQAAYCIVMVVVALLLTFWITKRWEGGLSINKYISNINSEQAEVIHVTTTRAIKREDAEDFGVAYYIDVLDKGVPKTLFLWGQYLDELEYDKRFPNTEFEIIRKKGSDEFIDFKTLGQYFKEEKTLPPFDKPVWDSGTFPVNGQILDQTIDQIK
ncbi:hypothetical protein [Ohtaekwangia koreensis]|uniref:Uncharacterized protein n=1 Tax=Ohtaekwangia koreensis TaxID=688867 RepID=A0A1T5MLH0_9BACT|nr:hypothetical protein [Ohtaekwangia koreensis]SKC88834.1 hypothetical protein SAMN05660236_5706 [Ohtaekwangia koreensis]